MSNIMKNKKKKGFTLIEMVAVVAIIGILAAILVPKITGYMKEAKKTGVIDQARKVSQAYETAKMKDKVGATDVKDDIQKAIDGNPTMKSLIDNADLTKVIGEPAEGGSTEKTTVKNCIDITNGAEFNVSADGKLILGTVVPKTTK